jgi:membrane associated rhomboid family serine protease
MKTKKENFPLVTYAIILASAILTINFTFLPSYISSPLLDEYALHPNYISHGIRLIGLVSYMFLNIDWEHFLLNAFALFGLGTIVEREIGSKKFGIVYLISGIIAALAQVFFAPTSTSSVVGASGAIFGVLAVLLLLVPFKKIQVLQIPIPAILIALLMFSVEVIVISPSFNSTFDRNGMIASFLSGIVLSFWIDSKRALKGIIITATVAIILYLVGIYFGLIHAY